tara:strand:- start:493 stop:897 length:405 start_codon:yes stop_codon:yes gene_type:complete
MSESIDHFKIQIGSEKSFGIVFAIIFLIIALILFSKSSSIYVWSLIASIFFFLSAFIAPKLLIIPNKIWFKFGLLLGSIFAPITMALVYFISVFPIGLIMRLLGKDLLNIKILKSSKSYWIERKENVGSMKNQF